MSAVEHGGLPASEAGQRAASLLVRTPRALRTVSLALGCGEVVSLDSAQRAEARS